MPEKAEFCSTGAAEMAKKALFCKKNADFFAFLLDKQGENRILYSVKKIKIENKESFPVWKIENSQELLEYEVLFRRSRMG